jgi:DNA-binding response OmpR family regulator
VRIVVVEPDPRMREALTLALESSGHTVDGVADHDAALGVVTADRSDVVVSGACHIPTARAFRDSMRELAVPIVALADPEHLHATRKCGTVVLARPFRAAELLEVIRRATGGSCQTAP